MEVYQTVTDLLGSCGCKTKTQGLKISWRPYQSHHAFQMLVSRRDLLPAFVGQSSSFGSSISTLTQASREMLLQAMQTSVKSSMQHVYRRNWTFKGDPSSKSYNKDITDSNHQKKILPRTLA